MTEPPLAEPGADPLTWRRLSPWALAILFTQRVTRFVRENIPLLLGAGAGAALLERIGLRELSLALVVGLLIAGLVSLLYYRRFRFRLDGDVLVVQKGILERTEVKVDADRVQHIAIEQPFYLRPFDVVHFSLDTPGGITTEVELPGIRRELAEALRRAMEADRDRAPDTDPHTATDTESRTVATPRLLFRIGPGALTLHGLTSNHAYVIAVILAPLLQPLERMLLRDPERLAELPWLESLMASPVVAMALAGIGLLLVLVVISVAVSWMRFFDFQLFRYGPRYVQRSGLFNRQEQTLSTPKLQSIEWVQTALGRALGIGYLVCRQYGGAPTGSDLAGGRFLLPGLSRRDGVRLARAFWPDLFTARAHVPTPPGALPPEPSRPESSTPECSTSGNSATESFASERSTSGNSESESSVPQTAAPEDRSLVLGFRRVSPGYRRFMALRLAVVAVSGTGGIVLLGGPLGWLVFGLVVAILAWPIAHLRWLAVGWRQEGRHLLIRRGLLGLRTALFPLENIQAISLRRNWFQRRHGLATLHLQLASGAQRLPFIEYPTALAIANEALYRAEQAAACGSSLPDFAAEAPDAATGHGPQRGYDSHPDTPD